MHLKMNNSVQQCIHGTNIRHRRYSQNNSATDALTDVVLVIHANDFETMENKLDCLAGACENWQLESKQISNLECADHSGCELAHDAEFGESASCFSFVWPILTWSKCVWEHFPHVACAIWKSAMLVFRMRNFRLGRDESSVLLEQTSSKRINRLFVSNKANRKGIKLVKHPVLSSGTNFSNNSASNVVVMKKQPNRLFQRNARAKRGT